MSSRDFELFREWVEALVEEKLECALNRNPVVESLRRMRLEEKLINHIEGIEDGNEGKESE
jgi:hypothetical protein